MLAAHLAKPTETTRELNDGIAIGVPCGFIMVVGRSGFIRTKLKC